MTHRLAAPLRTSLVAHCDMIASPVAVFVSGGYDSWSLVFAARAAGLDVRGYVFHMDGVESEDLKLARANAREHSVLLTEVTLPRLDCHELVADIRKLKAIGCRLKAEIECVWPFLHAARQVAEENVLLGHGADDNYGTTKKAALHYKDDLDAFRAGEFKRSANQVLCLEKLFGFHCKTAWLPYEDPKVCEVFRGANWDDLHKPKLKQPTLDAFPEFARTTVIRQGLQVGDSGIRDFFETLVRSPYNVMRAKNPVAIYNAL